MITISTKISGFCAIVVAFTVLNSCSKKSTAPPVTTNPANLFGKVITFAGSGATGSADGIGTAASFFFPSDVVINKDGTLYVADSGNNLIRKITPDGTVTLFAGQIAGGSADGTGAAASFRYPYSIALDAAGNIYVVDQANTKIRKVTPAGVVTTIAGTGQVGSNNGPGNTATFYDPTGIAVDASGVIYISDQGNNRIRKIMPDGTVSTFAGSGSVGSADGTGTAATFYAPSGLALDATGNLYVADSFNNLIRKITPAGVVSTIAGSGQSGSKNGVGKAATFYAPSGLATDASGNLYVADGNNLIRKVSTTGEVTTYAGSGDSGKANGSFSLSSFDGPTGLIVDNSSNIAVYVADKNNNIIRKLTEQQ